MKDEHTRKQNFYREVAKYLSEGATIDEILDSLSEWAICHHAGFLLDQGADPGQILRCLGVPVVDRLAVFMLEHCGVAPGDIIAKYKDGCIASYQTVRCLLAHGASPEEVRKISPVKDLSEVFFRSYLEEPSAYTEELAHYNVRREVVFAGECWELKCPEARILLEKYQVEPNALARVLKYSYFLKQLGVLLDAGASTGVVLDRLSKMGVSGLDRANCWKIIQRATDEERAILWQMLTADQQIEFYRLFTLVGLKFELDFFRQYNRETLIRNLDTLEQCGVRVDNSVFEYWKIGYTKIAPDVLRTMVKRNIRPLDVVAELGIYALPINLEFYVWHGYNPNRLAYLILEEGFALHLNDTQRANLTARLKRLGATIWV